MNSDFLAAIEGLSHDRGVNRETMIQLAEKAFGVAARKSLQMENEIFVEINRKTGDLKAWAEMEVVEDVEDKDFQISLNDAIEQYPLVQIGDKVEWKIVLTNLGRIAAQVMKQSLSQLVKQAERTQICDEYREQLFQLVTGIVRRIERRDTYVELAHIEGKLAHEEKIPGESYSVGDHITALLIKVQSEGYGPSLQLSRKHEDFVRRLFEREVSEMSDNLVEIKAVAREAGYRSKIAVVSNDSRVDPVGACVGLRGSRVKTIVRELYGEKVDIIKWENNVASFVANALQPAKLKNVVVNEEKHVVEVTCAEDQLSLAIGRRGQNARLAARLTGWKIDINRAEDEPKVNIFADKIQHAIDNIEKVTGVSSKIATALVNHGYLSLDGLAVAEISDLTEITDIDENMAKQIRETADSFLH